MDDEDSSAYQYDTEVGEFVMLSQLHPALRAKVALANVMEMVGLVDMFVSRSTHEHVREGWEHRMNEIVTWCAQQSQEISVFGEAHDVSGTFRGE